MTKQRRAFDPGCWFRKLFYSLIHYLIKAYRKGPLIMLSKIQLQRQGNTNEKHYKQHITNNNTWIDWWQCDMVNKPANLYLSIFVCADRICSLGHKAVFLCACLTLISQTHTHRRLTETEINVVWLPVLVCVWEDLHFPPKRKQTKQSVDKVHGWLIHSACRHMVRLTSCFGSLSVLRYQWVCDLYEHLSVLLCTSTGFDFPMLCCTVSVRQSYHQSARAALWIQPLSNHCNPAATSGRPMIENTWH